MTKIIENIIPLTSALFFIGLSIMVGVQIYNAFTYKEPKR